MKKTLPAYQYIKQEILNQLAQGVWQEGERMPTEFALAKQFAVSRMTVNRALKELSEERILERRQGSGTFVAQRKYKNIRVEITNIAQDIKASKRRYHAQVISQQTLSSEDITPILQSHFNINPKDDKVRLYEVKIIHFADDKPVQYEERWVNVELVPQFIEQDFTKTNTSDYLIANVAFESGNYHIFAKNATPTVANALSIPEQAPTLLLQRSTLSEGVVVTFVNLWHAGERYSFNGQL